VRNVTTEHMAREQVKHLSHISIVSHTLEVKDSSELYVRVFPAGVFIEKNTN